MKRLNRSSMPQKVPEKLLLADDKEKEFKAGDVVRFADKDVHGLLNDGEGEFVYVSVTTPPINFRYAYKDKK